MVYGNAITGGEDNTKSYICNQPTPPPVPENLFLRNFKDHLGNDIDNPWIEKTHGGANAGISGAKIVWADEANLVHLASAPIVHDGSDAYLQFEVRASDIKSGNVVVAATKDGTVVWSWHLWFAPQSALSPIEVTNHQGVKYNFTTENLGWKPTKWESTVYQSPRSVKFRVEQTIANNGVKQYTDITITQDPGIQRYGRSTFYQWGRKDALSTTDNPAQGSFSFRNSVPLLQYAIQHPETMFSFRFDVGAGHYSYNWCSEQYRNLWSANYNGTEENQTDKIVKTIYDPSPAGFKLPAIDAFKFFDEEFWTSLPDGFPSNDKLFIRNYGYNFWTNSSHTATIYFPSAGYRFCIDGRIVPKNGWYSTATPDSDLNNYLLWFSWKQLGLGSSYVSRADATTIRPVKE